MKRRYVISFCALLAGALLLPASRAGSAPSLLEVSTDPWTNTTSQHATEVEPDAFSNGSAIVAAFQSGRFYDGGSSDIGFATSTDGGATWHHGFLPGISKVTNPVNPYDRVSDPAVAYDAAHGVWMIASLPISTSAPTTPAVIVNRSINGGLAWQHPVNVAPNTASNDKDWISCDNWVSSVFRGHCYVEWDDPAQSDLVNMDYSADGGAAWSTPRQASGGAYGLGGQPLVLPNGTVVVPFWSDAGPLEAIRSFDGGKTWSAPLFIANVSDHGDAGNLRSNPLPSAQEDGSGKIYLAWQDCRFRAGCAENDIVVSTSVDGATWTAPARVPIDPVSSAVDHFIPGIAADPATGGSTAHVAITFYYYSNTNCGSACRLGVGFISSHNGGLTWTPAQVISSTFAVTSIANTTLGRMVGDYIATAFSGGRAYGVFALANPPSGSRFDEAMYVPAHGLQIALFGPELSSAMDRADPFAHSDHPRRRIPPKSRY